MRVGAMIIALATTSIGCYFLPTASVRQDERPTAKDAYLYGRFTIKTNNEEERMRAAFIVKCQDGNEYKIPFSSNYPIQMIKISSSTCSLHGLVYVIGNLEKHQKDLSKDLVQNIQFKPGKAYYIGDFVLGTEVSYSRSYQYYTKYSITTYDWKLKRAIDDYDRTTHMVRRIFPNFVGFPTEKQFGLIGVPMEPAPPEMSERMSERERADQRQACRHTFGECRISCMSEDGGPTCLGKCIKSLDECRESIPD